MVILLNLKSFITISSNTLNVGGYGAPGGFGGGFGAPGGFGGYSPVRKNSFFSASTIGNVVAGMLVYKYITI